MKLKTFWRLVRWSFEEYLSFPMLEVLVMSAIIGVLAQIYQIPFFSSSYSFICTQTNSLFMFLTFGVSAVFARGFAGSMARGEDKLLLSYPVKRWHLFLSKFTAMFLTFLFVYFAAFAMHLHLNVLSPVEPMFYVALFALFIQILLSCAVTVAISMVTKKEIVAMLASILFLLGFENITGQLSYLSAIGRFKYIFAYFGELIRGVRPFGLESLVFTTDDIFLAVSIPLFVSLVLLVVSFVYFTRFMEVD